jgi:hypothetical protein
LRHEVLQSEGTCQEEYGHEVADATDAFQHLDYDETGRRQPRLCGCAGLLLARPKIALGPQRPSC